MAPTFSPPDSRFLVVTADDFGIGPETSCGILGLAARGVVTSTVLLVNSPFAAEAVELWRRVGRPVELGWHPCLTLDAPVLPPAAVRSLVGPGGRFVGLGRLLRRMALGRLRADEIEAELRAQFRRFVELVGGPPANVNAHHHVHVFRPVGESLRRVLRECAPGVFVRRVVEPARTLWRVPGARVKRAVLTRLGRAAAGRQAAGGLPGAEALLGITDPPCVGDPRFFARWLAAARERVVELTCHPGRFDPTLVGRDGTPTDGQVHRRVWELEQLMRPEFLAAVRETGFTLVSAAELAGREQAAA